jgi:hypothetical protein
MKTTLTQEEFDLLNLLLPKIPTKENFSINALHAEYVLKPLYPRGDGAIDLAKYGLARKSFADKGFYLHITNYLLEQNFAIPVSNTAPFVDLKLSEVGITVRAYSDVEKYFNSFAETTKEEIESRIPNLIQRISPFGEFTIEYNLPRTIVFTIADFRDLSDSEAIKKRDDKLEQKEELISIHEQRVKDEEALQYLVDEGYAINRHDINSPDMLYRQLTDEGRKLKSLGTLEKYAKFLALQEQKIQDDADQKAREVRRNIILFWVTIFIGVSTTVAAIYYFLEILRVQYHLGLPYHIFFP